MDESEVLPLFKNFNIKLNFSHTVADGQELISAKDGVDRTGLLVWRGARVFYDWCVLRTVNRTTEAETDTAPQSTPLRHLTVIELGGGLGFGSVVVGGLVASITAEQKSAPPPRSPISVHCTDFFLPALALAHEQIESNDLCSVVSTAQLDWCWALAKNEGEGELCLDPQPQEQQHQRLRSFCSRYIQTGGDDDDSDKNDLLLVALDCVYPDTRNDVLCGLFVTIAKLLTTKIRAVNNNNNDSESSHHYTHQQQQEDEEQTNSTSEASRAPPFLIMTFVERDVGLTLRRLITAASVCGLQVDPLELPILADKSHERKLFGRNSLDPGHCWDFVENELLEPTPDHQHHRHNQRQQQQHIASIWSILEKTFVVSDGSNVNDKRDDEMPRNAKKSSFACSGATWILKIQLATLLDDTNDSSHHEGSLSVSQKCCAVIEQLTQELDRDLFVATHDQRQLSTLKEVGLLAPNHFNEKWWRIIGYLSFKDTYLAARSLAVAAAVCRQGSSEIGVVATTATLDLKLDPALVQVVVDERNERIDEKFLEMEVEGLF